MKLFNLYKHEDCTDTAIEPLKHPVFIPEKHGYKIRVSWWNVANPENKFRMGIIDTVFIKTEEYRKWKAISIGSAEIAPESEVQHFQAGPLP